MPTVTFEPRECRVNTTVVLKITVLNDAGNVVNLSAVKVTIRNGLGTVLVNDESCTASTNTATYSYTFDTIGANYVADFTFTYSSTTYTDTAIFDVCNTVLNCPVTSTMLKNRYPILDANYPAGQTSFSQQIQCAFGMVKEELRNRDIPGWISRMLDAKQIKEPITEMAAYLCFAAIATSHDPSNPFYNLMLEADRKYREKMATINIYVDSDDDMTLESRETSAFSVEWTR